IGERVQRAAERRLSHLHGRTRAGARARRGSDRHASRRVRENRGERRQGRRLQRRVRRRKRRRAGIGVLAVAPRERGRSAEEGAVAGDLADAPRSRGTEKIVIRRMAAAALAVGAVAIVSAQTAQVSPIVAAMHDEMARSMAELRMKDAPAPYYIAYELQDRTMVDVSGRLGAV